MRPPRETARRGPAAIGRGGPAGPLAAAATALLLGAVGCSAIRPPDPTHRTAASPAEAAPTAAPATVSARPTPPPSARRALDGTSACVQFARAAATVDTTTGDLGQARQAAARAFGTPRLQALFDGAGEGRNREQESWQQHRARVTATAVPVVDDTHDAQDERAESGSEQPWFGTPVAVTVTGTARGTGGWTAATAPYQLDCLTVHDPVAGWLVDDVAITVLPPAAAAG